MYRLPSQARGTQPGHPARRGNFSRLCQPTALNRSPTLAQSTVFHQASK